jgi:hypothetical protein
MLIFVIFFMKILNLLLVITSLSIVGCKKNKVQEAVDQNQFPQQTVKIGEDEIKVDDINAIHEKTVAFAEIYRNNIMPFLALDFEIPSALNIIIGDKKVYNEAKKEQIAFSKYILILPQDQQTFFALTVLGRYINEQKIIRLGWEAVLRKEQGNPPLGVEKLQVLGDIIALDAILSKDKDMYKRIVSDVESFKLTLDKMDEKENIDLRISAVKYYDKQINNDKARSEFKPTQKDDTYEKFVIRSAISLIYGVNIDALKVILASDNPQDLQNLKVPMSDADIKKMNDMAPTVNNAAPVSANVQPSMAAAGVDVNKSAQVVAQPVNVSPVAPVASAEVGKKQPSKSGKRAK